MSSLANKIQLLRDFKKSLIDFLDSLIEIFPNEKQLIIYRIALKEIPTTDIINCFVQNIHPNKELVKSRNEEFFTKTNILKSIDSEGGNYLKKIWVSKSLEEGDRVSIWKWMDKFIRYTDMYINIDS